MSRPAIFCWGRFQPPHLGHAELVNYTIKLAKEWNGAAFLFTSVKDNDFDDARKRKTYNTAEARGTRNDLRLKKNENPLKSKDKVDFLKLMFGNLPIEIVALQNLTDIPVFLTQRGYSKLILVVGSDRFERMERQMREAGVHIVGKPRSKTAISATDIRKRAIKGNLEGVHSLLGKNISNKDVKHIVDLIKKNSYFAGKGYPGQGGRRKRRRSRKKRGGYWGDKVYPPPGSNIFPYNTFEILQRYRLYNNNEWTGQAVVISGKAGMVYWMDGNPITIAPNEYLVTLRGSGADGERRIVSVNQINYYQAWIPDGKDGPGGAGPRTPRSGHGSGGRRRRKTHKKRNKKRTRRRRSRRMSGGRPDWMPKTLGGVTLPRGRGNAKISDFIAFKTKLRFKKDLRPNEQGKFLFGPQKTNEGVKVPHFHGNEDGWIGWRHKNGISTLVINAEYIPTALRKVTEDWAAPVIAQIMKVFNEKRTKKSRATPSSGSRTPPRGPTRREQQLKGRQAIKAKTAAKSAAALRRLGLKTASLKLKAANPWKIRTAAASAADTIASRDLEDFPPLKPYKGQQRRPPPIITPSPPPPFQQTAAQNESEQHPSLEEWLFNVLPEDLMVADHGDDADRDAEDTYEKWKKAPWSERGAIINEFQKRMRAAAREWRAAAQTRNYVRGPGGFGRKADAARKRAERKGGSRRKKKRAGRRRRKTRRRH